jgi:citrate lyase subunit beta / citryl-CoA lyase
MKTRVQRSMLILPVHVRRFVEKVYLRGADAVVLDLEDAVPPAEKTQAREMVEDAVVLAGRGGADVLVRVNNDPDLLDDDVTASIMPGLHAIFLPKVESPHQVMALEERISCLERERGIEPGSVKIAVHIESPKGLLALGEVLAAGTRIESASLGVDDYCLEMGVEPTEEGAELIYPLSFMAVACKAAGVAPLGAVGTVAGFRDREGFRRAAEGGCRIGCEGAYCIHPDQVPILNDVFSPVPAKVEHCCRIVKAFEAGLKEGRAAVSLDGRMVDTPVYKRALKIMERVHAVEETEARKVRALAAVK